MAENDLALSLFSGKDGVEESQFRGNANCSDRERETSWRGVHCQRCCLTRSWRASLRRGSRKTHAHLSQIFVS